MGMTDKQFAAYCKTLLRDYEMMLKLAEVDKNLNAELIAYLKRLIDETKGNIEY